MVAAPVGKIGRGKACGAQQFVGEYLANSVYWFIERDVLGQCRFRITDATVNAAISH